MTDRALVDQFATKKIAVIGDIMLDRYIYGRVERISPEAPIPIVHRQETMLVPGGAGNTAANITALGAACALFGVIGQDTAGQEMQNTLTTFSIETQGVRTINRPTTEKIRVLGNHQQIVRIDHESTQLLDEEQTTELCQAIAKAAPQCDALLVCDYAKGVVTEQLMDSLRTLAQKQGIPLLADVRPEHKAWYHDIDFITPNKKETSGMAGMPLRTLSEAKEAGHMLARELKTTILLTMSEDGMLVINQDANETIHLPTKAQEVTDVSGAGDTVIATFTLALASGATPKQAAHLANHAASVVVAKLGTATVSPDELKATL